MEYGVHYRLVTPNRTIVFNDYTEMQRGGQGGYYLSGVSGLDGGALRATVERVPMRDGALIYDAYTSEMQPVLEGRVWATTPERCSDLASQLKNALRDIMRADGTLYFLPSGYPERRITVRAYDKVTLSGTGPTKRFQLSLVSPDDRSYASVINSQDSSVVTSGGEEGLLEFPFHFPFSFGTASAGGEITVTSYGEVETWPIFKIYGALSGPTIYNLTTGEQLGFPGMIIGAGDYIEIDTRYETARLNGSVANNMLQWVDIVNSSFFQLAPGDNALRLAGSFPDSNAKLNIQWRDAWV